jgi:hypothetical protein
MIPPRWPGRRARQQRGSTLLAHCTSRSSRPLQVRTAPACPPPPPASSSRRARGGHELAVRPARVQQLDYLLAELARVGAQAGQDLGGLVVAGVDQAEQQVAGIGFGMAERFSLA